jgi:hypothetical protein
MATIPSGTRLEMKATMAKARMVRVTAAGLMAGTLSGTSSGASVRLRRTTGVSHKPGNLPAAVSDCGAFTLRQGEDMTWCRVVRILIDRRLTAPGARPERTVFQALREHRETGSDRCQWLRFTGRK